MEHITIYTRTDCPYCVMAKDLLVRHGKQYKERVIGRDVTREAVLQLVSEQKISNKLPIVVYDGEYLNYETLLDKLNPPLKI